MKLGDDLIKKMFDDVEAKVDLLIEQCKTLQRENEALILKVDDLEAQLENKTDAVDQFSEQEALIQSKIDGLLGKLAEFSESRDFE